MLEYRESVIHGLNVFAIQKNSSLISKVKFSDLQYLQIIAEDDYVAANKPNVSRWFLLGDADDLDDDI